MGEAFFSIALSWVLDRGASHYMTSNKRVLMNRYKLPTPINMTLLEGQIIQVKEAGMLHAGSGIILKDVLYTPTFACNLFLFLN